jgi:molecular chaperone HtpG
MAKKQFKTESKRILELMINSIYTNKDIFLRELISNASDAIDKLAFIALTDEKVGMSRSDFEITLSADRTQRTLTVSDNGVGMTREELESNLGTIARSGSRQFKEDLQKEEGEPSTAIDIIGQFGVGFYSAFMVADQVTVISRAYGQDVAFKWDSRGADGYTITPCERDTVGTDVIMHIKADTDEESYSQYVEQNHIAAIVKKYSDYIRYPIRMLMNRSRMKERPADAGEDYTPEWEEYTAWETLNSMVPLWQRNKKDVKQEEYDEFYTDKFSDYEKPLATISVNAEGAVSFRALLFIPGRTPYDYYTREYEKGLQLYSSGVMIMDKCAELLPDYFSFVKGVVDTPDVSLNISREMLQHTRQLKVIATNVEKRIKSELLRMQKDEPDKYEQFWHAFDTQIKYGVVGDYGANKDKLRDLVMFVSSHENKLTTLADYKARMKEDQKYIYYAAGESAERIARLPQAERILHNGFEVLYLTDEVDEFVIQVLENHDGVAFKNVNDEDALEQSEEEKKAAEEKTQENRALLDFVKETLGDKIKEARISRILRSHAVCMTTDGMLSIEMEKYMKRRGNTVPGMEAERVLELNPESDAFIALKTAFDQGDRELAGKYAQLLYCQALLIAELPLEDPAAYSDLVCSLMK